MSTPLNTPVRCVALYYFNFSLKIDSNALYFREPFTENRSQCS